MTKNYTHRIKFLRVASSGNDLEEIQSTKFCKYRHNTLGITSIKC